MGNVQQRRIFLALPTLPAQVVVQEGRACATDTRARQPGESLLGMLWLSHPKGPSGLPPGRWAGMGRSSPASPRPRPTVGTAEPLEAAPWTAAQWFGSPGCQLIAIIEGVQRVKRLSLSFDHPDLVNIAHGDYQAEGRGESIQRTLRVSTLRSAMWHTGEDAAGQRRFAGGLALCLTLLLVRTEPRISDERADDSWWHCSLSEKHSLPKRPLLELSELPLPARPMSTQTQLNQSPLRQLQRDIWSVTAL